MTAPPSLASWRWHFAEEVSTFCQHLGISPHDVEIVVTIKDGVLHVVAQDKGWNQSGAAVELKKDSFPCCLAENFALQIADSLRMAIRTEYARCVAA